MPDWNRLLTNPVQLKLYVMLTGEVHAPGNVHYNPRSPKFKSMPVEKRFNPVFAYLVERPGKEFLLLDTGLHHSFAQSRYGNFGPILGSMVKVKAGAEMDVRSQLRSIGVAIDDIHHVLLSHLHLDHPSGLPYFNGARNLKVYVDEKEGIVANAPFGFLKGYVKKHLRGIELSPIPYSTGAAPFEHSWDFFGDGSTIVVRTPGHTEGHSSVILNAMEGPILLTFDAVHRRSNLDHCIPPSGDYGKAADSMRRIESFLKDHPKTRVIFGHDPDQLGTLILAPQYYS
ncbi:MAG: MBL fold metallo-hydrolase [bacterium]|jgi:N-acyl homoserine lactone hydrolase